MDTLMHNPKISIITVCRNSAKTIDRTINSVLSQTYSNLEYILIDGASTDGTLELIKKYEAAISYWVSEPDGGIYHAMNKGIEAATGDYIYFLGSDDWLADKDIIREVCEFLTNHNQYDFLCGKVMLFNSKHQLVKVSGRQLTTEEIKSGNMYPHQGLFAKREIMKEKFNLKYKVAADYEFLLRSVLKNCSVIFLDQIIAYYDISGLSSNVLLYDEYLDIIETYCGKDYLYKINEEKTYAHKSFSVKKALKKLIGILGMEKRMYYYDGWKAYQR